MTFAAAAAAAVLSLFAQSFGGTWTCINPHFSAHWSIEAAPGSAWTTVRWGDQQSADGGIAYVAFLPALGHWVYRDFHYDGSYADLTGAQNGDEWRWTGPFYRDNQTLNGDILWKRTSATRIDRTFRALTNGKLVPAGSDYCTRTAPPSP